MTLTLRRINEFLDARPSVPTNHYEARAELALEAVLVLAAAAPSLPPFAHASPTAIAIVAVTGVAKLVESWFSRERWSIGVRRQERLAKTDVSDVAWDALSSRRDRLLNNVVLLLPDCDERAREASEVWIGEALARQDSTDAASVLRLWSELTADPPEKAAIVATSSKMDAIIGWTWPILAAGLAAAAAGSLGAGLVVGTLASLVRIVRDRVARPAWRASRVAWRDSRKTV